MRGDKTPMVRGKGENTPLPYNVDKKSVNDSGPTVRSQQLGIGIRCKWIDAQLLTFMKSNPTNINVAQ